MQNPRIDLAHVPDFRVGGLNIHPSTRELSRGGERLVIEPRVMQVLVALHRAGGAVVSKDDLAQSCWEGRVVGEDAINRVLSRLRKVSESIGKDTFHVETVTRVGYRMVVDGAALAPTPKADVYGQPNSVGRRSLVIGAAMLTAVGGGAWFLTQNKGNAAGAMEELPPQVRELVRRGREARLYGTPEQTEQAIALFRQATRQSADSAYLWGILALAYSDQAYQSRQQDYERLNIQAISSAERALAIDPDNAEAQLVLRFIKHQKALRPADFTRQLAGLVEQHPANAAVNRMYALHLSQLGRNRKALTHLARAIATEPYSPPDADHHGTMLWSVNRLEEADTVYERGLAQWPRHYGLWYSRYKQLVYTGRLAEARAMLLDVGKHPTGIPDESLLINDAELKAFESRTGGDIDHATQLHRKAARLGIGYAQDAMMFTSATEQPDLMFEIAQGLFFSRGFVLGENRYMRSQGLYKPGKWRPTYFLFYPPMARYRSDARFDAILAELGIKDYWRTLGVRPDYLA
ncbi:MAG: winged helix-turn-helix domain-containing protein [Sphingopyxis sp.]|nr:winged helix-turn-helix domain-containing protein [Sphingopyxis sp.]